MPTYTNAAVQTGSVNSYTIPTYGMWRIEARGAGGGGSTGRAAAITADFVLNAGEVLNIVAGGQGQVGSGGTTGGGGGSYVWKTVGTQLLVAAGGGGGHNSNSWRQECDASTTTAGRPGSHGAGGTNGYGGLANGSGTYGAGGAGWLGDGGEAQSGSASDGTSKAGKSRVNVSYPFRGGGADAGAIGGYGGGGGSHGNTGGGAGGGGYSGGGGSNHDYGGGGGSYVDPAGTPISASIWGSATGGSVVITLISSAPTTPGSFTSPTVGSTVDSTGTVAVGASTDPDGNALTYEWDLTRDGVSWVRKRNLTAGTSWTYNYSSDAETAGATAQWRVRAYDGTFYSGYSLSPAFRIHHPVAPSPTGLTATPGSVDIGDTVRIGWSYSDSADAVPDAQVKYQLRWRKVE